MGFPAARLSPPHRATYADLAAVAENQVAELVRAAPFDAIELDLSALST